jgi:hypothetical protein
MPFFRPGTATQEPAAMELLSRKVAVVADAAAVAVAAVVADRALLVVGNDAMLRAVDALQIGTHITQKERDMIANRSVKSKPVVSN